MSTTPPPPPSPPAAPPPPPPPKPTTTTTTTTTSLDRLIEIRRARPEDYEAVKAIGNVALEVDYLPSLYHQLISDPDFVHYVCLMDGEVAGFEGVCLLDDNNTLMPRSLRVKEKFNGQGIPSRFRKQIYEFFKDFPGQKRIRTVCSDASHYVKSKKFRRENKTLKIEKRICFHDVDVRLMGQVTADDMGVKSITWEEFGHLFQTAAVKHYLYPDYLVSADYWFYDATVSNIRHMRKIVKKILVTKPLFKFLPTSETKDEVIITPCNGEDCKKYVIQGMLGLLASYYSPSHLLFTINLGGKATKGKEVEEITALLRHSLCFMQSICAANDKKPQRVKFVFVCNGNTLEEPFFEAAKPFGLRPSRHELDRKQQYYFEQDLQKFSHFPMGASALISSMETNSGVTKVKTIKL